MSDPTPPQVIQPSPVPFTFQTGIVQGPTGQLVVMQIASPTGQATYFMTPDDAQRFGEALAQLAGQARSGLIVPVIKFNGKDGPHG